MTRRARKRDSRAKVEAEAEAYDLIVKKTAREIQEEDPPLEVESLERLESVAGRARRLHERLLEYDPEE